MSNGKTIHTNIESLHALHNISSFLKVRIYIIKFMYKNIHLNLTENYAENKFFLIEYILFY